jgi:two-component system nitrate/nitrite response regulator NarL
MYDDVPGTRSSTSSAAATRAAPDPVVRLMVVDDHPVVCDGVRLLLDREPGFAVVASATTAAAALGEAARAQPDVVLLDLRLPDSSPPDVVRGLRAACPPVRVVLFTAHPDHVLLSATLAQGVEGCLLKDAGTNDLASSLRDVVNGRAVLDPRLAALAREAGWDRGGSPGLTPGEQDVVRLVATGLTNPEIAQQLGLAGVAVKEHLRLAMLKLGARNRVEVIGRAHETGLL